MGAMVRPRDIKQAAEEIAVKFAELPAKALG